MNYPAHKTEGVNCFKAKRFYPFVFTGKERGEETGYGYFGARYMDHELMTMWLSVDPMADKYPGISPYAYCAWNPIKLVDPDGEEFIGAVIGAFVGAATEVISQTVASGVTNLSNGDKFFKNWSKNMDWFDVGVSASVGLMDGFVPGAGKLTKKAANTLEVGLTVIGDGVKAGVDRKEGKYEMVGAGKDWKECLVDFGFSLLSSSISAAVYGPIVKGNYSSATGKLCSQWLCQSTLSSTGNAFKKILLKPPKAIIPHVEIDKMTWSFISDN